MLRDSRFLGQRNAIQLQRHVCKPQLEACKFCILSESVLKIVLRLIWKPQKAITRSNFANEKIRFIPIILNAKLEAGFLDFIQCRQV